MYRRILLCIATIACLEMPGIALGQMEFISTGEKVLVPTFEFATTPGKPLYGGELSYTADGQLGLGAIYTAGGSPTTYAAGAELEGSFLAPTREAPLGVESFLSYSYVWSPAGGYYSGNSISAGAEAYLSFPLAAPSSALEPFVGVARSFQSLGSGFNHANRAFYSYSCGCDAVEGVGRGLKFVIVPGAAYEEDNTYFDLTVSLACRLNWNHPR